MENYKYIMEFVDGLIKRDKPFLIIKYCLSIFDIASNAYEIVTIEGSKLRYLSIDRNVALEAIDRYELPLLHKIDNRNMIWGDKKFKKKYKKVCKGENKI